MNLHMRGSCLREHLRIAHARVEWHVRYDVLMDQGQPEHCTRRRLKPFIDDCRCEWCEQVDELMMERPHAVVSPEES